MVQYFSNWDPYEPAATSQLKVAVASDDAGAEIMGLSLNVGDSVLEALGPIPLSAGYSRGLPKKPWKELRTVITMRH